METWWEKKKAKTRRNKKSHDHYTFWDGVLDVLFWVPELFLLPFRLIFWLLRGFGRVLDNIFDIF